MDAFHRLQFQLMQDELRERFQNYLQYIGSLFPKRQNKIGVSLAEVGISQEAEGRVWVEVGTEGLKLRVSHLHPANPAVAEALKRKCNERKETTKNGKSNKILSGQLIYPPQEDKISLSSLEDYWFNHWQGPFITADSNCNSYSLSKLRRSYRKSKRSYRCSICHKKRIVTVETENKVEKESGSILAHLPSIKIEAKVHKDDADDKSEDGEISDDTVSRCSASDEQLARVYRVLDNELRTSFTLFADEEAVSEDVVDSEVCMDACDESIPNRYLASPFIVRQSKSCPCSPKLSTKPCNSPKSRYSVSSSKFSLSSSLLAIHRQASNSLMPEFLKSDSSKSEKSESSPAVVQKISREQIKFSSRKSLINDIANKDDSIEKNEQARQPELNSEDNSSNRSFLYETQSMPTLRLSKMSMTYRGGNIISEENEAPDSDVPEENYVHGAVALSRTPNLMENVTTRYDKDDLCSNKLLPDVVLDVQLNRESPDQLTNYRDGVVNLGFDGMGETSDYVEYDEDSLGQQERKIFSCQQQNLDEDKRASSDSLAKDLSCEREIKPDNPKFYHQQEAKNEQTSPPLANENLESGECNTFIEKDVMQEARAMVFWWRKGGFLNEEDSEFCLHETECKVKQKPLLMFLHGVGSSADVWNQQLWYFLSCGYEVVAPDLLGHGLSSAPRNKKYYSFSNMLDYISLVFDLFVPHGRKCVIIGHNYGCALAVALARGRSLSVSLVVLASCGGPNPLAPYSNNESSLNSTVTKLLVPFISCGCLSRELMYTARGKHYEAVISDCRGISSTPRYVIDNVKAGQYWPEGDMAFHRRITIPTLLLQGMKDNSVSFVEMCEMEKTIPRAFLELIPGAGHELMTDSAEEVCHAIHRFIRRWKNNF